MYVSHGNKGEGQIVFIRGKTNKSKYICDMTIKNDSIYSLKIRKGLVKSALK